MTLSSLEARIRAEWSAVRAFVALHPCRAVLAALALGAVLGRLV